MSRIGFLYNHHTNHQVLHTAPVAFALSHLDRTIEVEIVASNQRQLDTARRIGERWPGHAARFRLARQPWTSRCLQLAGVPSWLGNKRGILRSNLDYFAELDALVVPERTSTELRQYPALRHVQLIHIPHGAGDRAVGYEPRNSRFDLVLLAGEKCRRRMHSELGIPEQRLQVIGYPKFEASSRTRAQNLFPQSRPTVLYNPHFDPHLSSWPRWGLKILDWFAGQSRFNLIFAPHVMLYRRPLRHRARPLRRYRRCRHMLLDTGSDRCIDMTYTRAADIYLGDVSSQAYEFARWPRPAVFLNALGLPRWQADASYRHWHMGTVVDELDELERALCRPLTRALATRQRELVGETFQQDDAPASLRGALAIRHHLLHAQRRAPEVRPVPALGRPAAAAFSGPG